MKHFATNRKQKVVLNGQFSSWTNVKSRVHQDSILKPLLFLIYINDSADGLSSNTNLLVDDTSVFLIHDLVIMTSEFNSDLARIKQWDFQWKINFNPDIYNQAQEVMFLRHHRKTV